ncbi:recombinase family protein [Streptomyces sp. 6N106]|uniref:recombinase family protein n=1 Tax=Streptomyces sp. 6N106 TaxID=3457418 RepID=UPI003FCF29A6
MSLRFLGARRLSRVKDNSTSFERQGAAIVQCSAELGGRIIGWADDPDVSAAKVPPMDRPELGPWLERPTEYDGIVWWRLDRAVRSMGDMADLARWAKQHGKRLVFAEGPGGGRLELDMSSPMSELILMILAFAAQMEVQATQERVEGTTEYLRSVGRWGGGRVPFGRQPVPHPTETDSKGEPAGWWLGYHEATAEIIDHMVDLVLLGHSYHYIAEWVNTEHPGITPANHRRALKKGKTDPTARWNPGMVSSLLRQPSLRGHKEIRGEIVRDEEGEPVLCGDPIITDTRWHQLQAAMDKREQRPSENRSNLHPLLGVLHCGTCQGRMYQGWISKGPRVKAPKRQYRCAARAHGRECAKPAYVAADPVDTWVEAQFLARLGAAEVLEVIETPGVDHREEIAELEETIKNLGERIADLGGVGPAVDTLMGQIRGRSVRLEKLRQEPVRPPGIERRPTGKVYAELWRERDAQGRLRLLRDAGVRVAVGQTTRGARDVAQRLSWDLGAFEDPAAEALDAIEREELYME